MKLKCIEENLYLCCEKPTLYKLNNLEVEVNKLYEAGRSIDEIARQLLPMYSSIDISKAYNNIVNIHAVKPSIPIGVDSDLSNIILDLASTCNLSCEYCYRSSEGNYDTSNPPFMDKRTGENAVDFLIQNSGNKENIGISLFGGEPLLNFSLMKHLVPYAIEKAEKHKKRVYFSITTNGTLLDREIIDFLNEYNIRVLISIDGDKKTHDRLRHYPDGKGSYDKIISNVKYLLSSRNGLNVSARPTITRYNTDLRGIFRHLVDLGFKEVTLSLVDVPPDSPCYLTNKDLKNLGDNTILLMDDYLEYITRHKEIIGFSNITYLFPQLYNRSVRHYGCAAGKFECSITTGGDIYPCQRFVGLNEWKMGNISQGKFIQHPEFLGDSVERSASCQKCWARYICGGGCPYVNKVIKERRCIFTQESIKLACKTYARLFEKNPEIMEKLCKIEGAKDRNVKRRGGVYSEEKC